MPKKQFLLLNGILIIYLLVIILSLPFGASYELLAYATDAKEYLEVRNEFFDFQAQGFSATRPFLYPLFLKIFYGIGGVKGVWIAQLLLWLASANFIYFAIRRYSESMLPAVFGTLLFVTNFTLIAMTYHALTEIITVFLLSWLVYLLTEKDKGNVSWILKIIAIAIALVLVKPLFIYPTLATLIAGIAFYFRRFLARPGMILVLLLIVSPLIFQYSVMKMKYGKWELSQISQLTIRNYIVAQGYERIEGLSRDESKVKANSLTEAEMKKRVKDHLYHYKQYYFENVEQNVTGEPYYLKPKPEWKHKAFYYYQFSMNKKYWKWMDVLIVLSVITLIHQLWKKKLRENFLNYAPLALLFYIVYSSGISFYQGDRLTVSALPLGVFSLMIPIGYAVKSYRLRKAAR